MPAYWIARNVMTDFSEEAQAGMGRYAGVFTELSDRYPRRTLSRGHEATVLEGDPRPGMFFIHEFESAEVAQALWEDPLYQEVKALRQRFSSTEVILLDGTDAWGRTSD